MSINRVILVGRLTRDPEVRSTTTGKQVAEFSLAVDKRFKREGEKDANFFRVIAWNQTAEYVGNYMNKGRLVAVDGRLEQREYTTQDGQRREVVEIIADNVQGLDRPREGGGEGGYSSGAPRQSGGSSGRTADPAPAADEFDPFADD